MSPNQLFRALKRHNFYDVLMGKKTFFLFFIIFVKMSWRQGCKNLHKYLITYKQCNGLPTTHGLFFAPFEQ